MVASAAAAGRNNNNKKKDNNKNKPGKIFLGRDEKTYGKDGIGWIDYDPDFECGGNTSSRQCPFVLKEADRNLLRGGGGGGSKGRLLHVGIASYRDPLCPMTLYNLFTKSQHPENLRVRVLQQNDITIDTDCLVGYCALMERDFEKDNNKKNDEKKETLFKCPHEDAIFIHQVDAKEAKGPTHARALLSEDIAIAWKDGKVHPQDYCMSIDSHMDFEPLWDESMVEMWDMAKNEYAVLSTYVAGDEQLGVNLNGVHEVPHLCMVTFTTSVRTHATKCLNNMPKPKLTNAIYGAGLAFSKCHAELKVPVDPHTPYIFDGEEFNRAARFWTYGYDIYSPHRVYVLHKYHESQSNPTTASWHRNTNHQALQNSLYRLNSLIDVPLLGAAGSSSMNESEKLVLRQSRYGLGDRRTLDQLIEFSGVDLRNRKPSIDGKNRCGNLQWVPFVESIHGVNYIPRFDDENENPLDEYDEGSIWWSKNKKSKFPHAAAAAAAAAAARMDQDKQPDERNLPTMTHAHKKETGDLKLAKKTAADAIMQKALPLVDEPENNGLDDAAAANAVLSAQIITSAEQHHHALHHEDVKIPQHGGGLKATSNRQPQRNLAVMRQHGRMAPQQMQQHGARYLPWPIKASVTVLVLGLILTLVVSAKSRKGGRRRYGVKKRTV